MAANPSTLDFVKHKFDMLLLVLLVSILLVGVVCAEHWHDSTLVIWATNTIAGLIGAFINMLTNRASASERASDSPNTTTVTTTAPVQPPPSTSDVHVTTTTEKAPVTGPSKEGG